MEVKTCNICREIKPLNDFSKPKGVAQKTTKACSTCRKKALDRYSKNKSRYKARARQYRRDNALYYSEYLKKWKQANRGHFNANEMGRYYGDARYYSISREQSRPRRFLRCKGSPKSHIIVIGCSKEDFIRHIELQFKPGMSWENYGSAWQFDHVFPLSRAYDLGAEVFQMALNYRNIQPLWSREQLTKGFSIVADCWLAQLLINSGVLNRAELIAA